MPEDRYLLGYGERLTARIAPPGGGGGSDPAYDFGEAVQRLSPMVSGTAEFMHGLPREARPEGQSVGVITLHPQWIAKSYHPQQLLSQYRLRQVGSRPTLVRPERWTRKSDPELAPTTDLYVAGTTESFDQWASDIESRPSRVSRQIQRIEAVRAPDAPDRLRGFDEASWVTSSDSREVLEVVLHASEDASSDFIVDGFARYAQSLEVFADLDRRIYAGGLCFLPVLADPSVIEDLALFAFLRVARPMPQLRMITPLERSVASPGLTPSPLPDGSPVDPDLRIAVFDGGFPMQSALQPWVTAHDPPGIGNSVPEWVDHGHDVTSSVLFGPLTPGDAAEQPYGQVDHFRVLDEDCGKDPYDLYEVLGRIRDVLKARQPQFVNLSIGPVVPIEDDEVHPWTAVLDEHLATGEAIATIAVGNWGEKPLESETRIQVPSDAVNGLAVGAADSRRDGWHRAVYSSRGPGRSPGRIKPDIVHFGGDEQEPFLVYDQTTAPDLAMTRGTSFAAPSALRMASGIRAHFGDRIGPLALKALLVHTADKNDESAIDVGHGRARSRLSDVVLCEDGIVRVLYQGELSSSQYLRAPIPVPDEPLTGMVRITSTFCYSCRTDPQDPGSYTRSGLEVTFRPHVGRFANDEATEPASKPFFSRTQYDNEHELRRDAQKWETSMHATKRFRATSLDHPMFDIHHNAREEGGAPHDPTSIRYALVVTIESPNTVDLYDQVVRAYAGWLETLTPLISIPIQT